MPYCISCGAQITENTKYCPHCGVAQNEARTARPNREEQKRLHCPKCKSTNFTPIVESNGSIGSVGRVSKNVAVTGTSIENRNYWLCRDCGHKFRNLEDLVEDYRKRIFAMKIICRGICILFALVIIFPGLVFGSFWRIAPFLIIPYLMFRIFEHFIKKSRADFDAEIKKLRKACFD